MQTRTDGLDLAHCVVIITVEAYIFYRGRTTHTHNLAVDMLQQNTNGKHFRQNSM